VSGGSGAPVREQARGPAIQLWGEAEMGGLVCPMWERSGASTRGWQLTEVGVGAASSGASGGFYRRERENGGLGTSC
jgi:hypothetical protein